MSLPTHEVSLPEGRRVRYHLNTGPTLSPTKPHKTQQPIVHAYVHTNSRIIRWLTHAVSIYVRTYARTLLPIERSISPSTYLRRRDRSVNGSLCVRFELNTEHHRSPQQSKPVNSKKRTTTPMQSAKTYVTHTRTYVRTNRH